MSTLKMVMYTRLDYFMMNLKDIHGGRIDLEHVKEILDGESTIFVNESFVELVADADIHEDVMI